MRMKSLILIFIALGCGLVASIGISQVMDRGGSGGQSMEMEQILVAMADVDIGTKLDAQNVKLEDWPKAKVPEGAIRRLEDVKDKFANSRFFKGEPIHVSKVADQLGNVASKVPPGYRAMPVKVDEDTVMKGISPGDRVDVMVFLRKSEGIPETGAFTFLKNVRVFAVNTNTERSTDTKGSEVNFRTVSLLVKPEHSRELAVAAQMGKILLTLRRPDEVDALAGEEVTSLSEILSGKSENASEPVDAPAASTPSPFIATLQNATNNNVAAPISGPKAFVMHIFGPAEVKQYEWDDRDALPTESSAAQSGSAPAPAVSPEPSTAKEEATEETTTDNSLPTATPERRK